MSTLEVLLQNNEARNGNVLIDRARMPLLWRFSVAKIKIERKVI